MNRDLHLRFCVICKNRDWNLQSGVVCVLTKNVPVFKEECDDFLEDQAEFEKICSEKIKSYGLAKKEKRFFKELISDNNAKSRLTQLIVFIKPRTIEELPNEIHITKSNLTSSSKWAASSF